MIERLECYPAKNKFGGAVEHCLIKRENFEVGKSDEGAESVVEVIKISFDAAFVYVQHDPCGLVGGFCHTARRFSPSEESPIASASLRG